MAKTKHSYLIYLDVNVMDGKTISDSQHIPRGVDIDVVLRLVREMANCMEKAILDNEFEENEFKYLLEDCVNE